MALNFPSNPNIDDTYTAANGIVYKWNGNGWVVSCNGGGTGTDLGISERTSTSLDITSSTGTDVTVPEATGTLAGVMTAAHQLKVEASLQPEDIGTDIGDIVELENVGSSPEVSGLPSVDGSQLSNVPWTDGQVITHWGNTSQPYTSDNSTSVNIDNGQVIDMTLTGDHNVTFESSVNQDNTSWVMIMQSGGFTPVFLYSGATVIDPTKVDWVVSTTFWVTFQKIGTNIYWSERALG